MRTPHPCQIAQPSQPGHGPGQSGVVGGDSAVAVAVAVVVLVVVLMMLVVVLVTVQLLGSPLLVLLYCSAGGDKQTGQAPTATAT